MKITNRIFKIALMSLTTYLIAGFTSSVSAALRVSGNRLFDGNQVVQLAGGGFYGAIAESHFSISQYLDTLKASGCNFTRVWVRFPWCRKSYAFSTDSYGKFKLRKLNQAHFDRLKKFVIEAERRGIYVQVCLLDGVELDNSGNRFPYSPLNSRNNRNRWLKVPGHFDDAGGTGGIFRNKVLEPYVVKVVETLSPHGNVIYEIMNEANSHGIDASLDLHKRMVAVVRQQLQRLRSASTVISVNCETRNALNWAISNPNVNMVSWHCKSPGESDDFRWVPKPMILSTDGDKLQAASYQNGGLSDSQRQNRLRNYLSATFGGRFTRGQVHFEGLFKDYHGKSWGSLNYNPRPKNAPVGLLREIGKF